MSAAFYDPLYEHDLAHARAKLAQAVNRCEYLTNEKSQNAEAIHEEMHTVMTLERMLIMDEFQRRLSSITQMIESNSAVLSALKQKTADF